MQCCNIQELDGDQQLELVNGKGAEVMCVIKTQEKASISSPQNACNFPSALVGLRPAVGIAPQISSKRLCRTRTVGSSRGTPWRCPD